MARQPGVFLGLVHHASPVGQQRRPKVSNLETHRLVIWEIVYASHQGSNSSEANSGVAYGTSDGVDSREPILCDTSRNRFLLRRRHNGAFFRARCPVDLYDGNLVTTFVFAVFWRGDAAWRYPAISAGLFLAHYGYQSKVTLSESPQFYIFLIGSACIVFACTYWGGRELKKWEQMDKVDSR